MAVKSTVPAAGPIIWFSTVKYTLWILLSTGIWAQNNQISGHGCYSIDDTFFFECTVIDDSHQDGTVWSGTAFNCPNEMSSITHNRIYLRHSQFDSGAQGTCNDGALYAEGTSVNGSLYSSTLTVHVMLGMRGQSITCSMATSGETVNGTENLQVGVIPMSPPYTSVSFPAPFKTFAVLWTKPLDVIGDVGGYMTNVSGDCGQCNNLGLVDANTSHVSCSGWEPLGQTCNISVYTITEDCQFRSEEPALATVYLKLPEIPKLKTVLATYDLGGVLLFITTTLSTKNQIFTDENGLKIFCIILHAHSSGETTEVILDCPQTNNCTPHVFRADQTSGEYIVRVGAKTAVGKVVQPENTMVAVGASNTFVHVAIHVLESYTIVNCFSFTTYNYFSCQIEYGQNCDTLDHEFRKEKSTVNDSDVTLILRDILPATHYCFVLIADNQSYSVNVEGTFSGYSYTGQPPTMTNAVTGHGSSTFVITTSITSGVAVIMSLVALIALVQLVLVCLKNRKPTSRSTEPTTVYYSTIGERDRPRAEGRQSADPTYEEVTAVKVPEISTDPNDAYHPVRTVETNEAYQISIRNVH